MRQHVESEKRFAAIHQRDNHIPGRVSPAKYADKSPVTECLLIKRQIQTERLIPQHKALAIAHRQKSSSIQQCFRSRTDRLLHGFGLENSLAVQLAAI